jgi:hypothetical protein
VTLLRSFISRPHSTHQVVPPQLAQKLIVMYRIGGKPERGKTLGGEISGCLRSTTWGVIGGEQAPSVLLDTQRGLDTSEQAQCKASASLGRGDGISFISCAPCAGCHSSHIAATAAACRCLSTGCRSLPLKPRPAYVDPMCPPSHGLKSARVTSWMIHLLRSWH